VIEGIYEGYKSVGKEKQKKTGLLYVEQSGKVG
jgi:hypothetical protein